LRQLKPFDIGSIKQLITSSAVFLF